MENPTATPAQAVTPAGSNGQGQPQPSAPAPAATATGAQSEGTVTISTKEFAQLQRDSARMRSFEKRATFQRGKPQAQAANGDPEDQVNQRITELESAKAAAEQRAMQLEVRGRVRDLLDKDEFNALPKSTRDLILKNPHMLSDATEAEEALLDIEDFVREQVAGLALPAQTPQQQKNEPKGHETPSAISGGSPAPAAAAGLEDTSNLRGVALSRAVLRNTMKKQKGAK